MVSLINLINMSNCLDWASLATISSRPEIASFPFANVFSVSDGQNVKTSTGIPYFYLSKMEMSVHDLKVHMH